MSHSHTTVPGAEWLALMADVARIYDQAAERPGRGGGAPTAAVAEHFGWSRSTAARRIAFARKLKFLPLTRQGKVTSNARVGLHRSGAAEIGRGTNDYRTYRACVTCLMPWPCSEAPSR